MCHHYVSFKCIHEYEIWQNKADGQWLGIRAATWQNQQNECAPSEDSDQPGHPSSLITVFACAQWVAKNPSFLHADREDSDQTGWMRLIWVFAGRPAILLVLSCRGWLHSAPHNALTAQYITFAKCITLAMLLPPVYNPCNECSYCQYIRLAIWIVLLSVYNPCKCFPASTKPLQCSYCRCITV